jgi:Tfp pilus assembly protein PilF
MVQPACCNPVPAEAGSSECIHGNTSADRSSCIVIASVWCAEGDWESMVDVLTQAIDTALQCVSAAMRCFRIAAAVMIMAIGVIAPLAAEDPEAPTNLRGAYLLWQEGYQLHLAGAYEEAIKRFEASIEFHPTAEAHTFLGWSMSHLGRLEEAIEECKKAIALDPDFGNPYNDIGVYLTDLGRPDEAISWLEKAIGAKRYCCYQFPHFNLGRIQLMKGQLQGAKRSFERALSYDPNYLPARHGLAFIRSQGEEL